LKRAIQKEIALLFFQWFMLTKVHKAEIGKGRHPDVKRYRRRLTGFCSLWSAFSSFFPIHPHWRKKKVNRVLILPLTIHSEKDLTFLNKGIMDMMASRISQSATVIREARHRPRECKIPSRWAAI
jgi:hypothetical protein